MAVHVQPSVVAVDEAPALMRLANVETQVDDCRQVLARIRGDVDVPLVLLRDPARPMAHIQARLGYLSQALAEIQGDLQLLYDTLGTLGSR